MNNTYSFYSCYLICKYYNSIFSLTLNKTDLSYIHSQAISPFSQYPPFFGISPSCTRNYHSAQEIHKYGNAIGISMQAPLASDALSISVE